MKKSTIGLILFALGFFTIIMGAQDFGPKTPPEVFVAGAVFCLVGLILFLLGRKRSSRKPKSVERGSEKAFASKLISTPGKPIYEVNADRSEIYTVPKRCCACAGPAEKLIVASCQEMIGNRRVSLSFPICRTCHKERYRFGKSIAPVEMKIGIYTEGMEFKFSNREYAEMFADMNKGKFLKPL